MKTKIKNVRLYTGEREFSKGCVLVEGNRILFAGDESSAPSGFREDRLVDGRGGLLAPGFYNAHCHASMVLLRGVGSDKPLMDWLSDIFPIEDRLTDEIVYAGSLLACMEMLRRGCVCFNDMYMHMDATAQAVRASGIRALLGRGFTSEANLEKNVKLFEDWNGACGGRLRVAITPYAEYGVSEELFIASVREAKRLGAAIHTHVSETEAEVAACKERHGGRTPVRLMNDLGLFSVPCVAAHCVHVDAEEIDILAKNGVYVATNPASNLKLGSGIAPVRELQAAGARLCLGTDGAASNNALDMQADMRLMSLLQKGVHKDASAMDARTSFAVATRGGALACGFSDAGLLKEGYLADMVLYDDKAENMVTASDMPSELVYSAQGLNVRMTIVDGNIVYSDGVFSGFDGEKAIDGAKAAIRSLLAV